MSYSLTLLQQKTVKDLMTLKLLENNIIITISLIIINIISLIFINISYIPIINIISYVCIICLINIYLLIIKIITTIYNLLVKPWQPYLISKTQNINDLKIELEDKNKRILDLKIKLEDLLLEDKNKILINKIRDINVLKIELKHKDKNINDLKNKLEIRQNIINALKIQLEDKNKDINVLKNKNDETNKCSICLDNTISHCCSPCGHVYCSDCIKKTDNCYICRGIIHNKIKLFF